MFIFTFLGKVLVGFSYHYINILSSILYSIIMVISGRSRGETWAACPPLFLPQTKAPQIFLRLPPSPYLRVWMTSPPFLSEGLNLPLVIAFNWSNNYFYK